MWKLRLAVLATGVLLSSSLVTTAGEFSIKKHEGGIAVHWDGELLTDYRIDLGPKPILWPVIGPSGEHMTRSHPLAEREGERKDHVHHRSLWFTHGEVNGIDFWGESPNSGKIKHREFLEVSSGPQPKIVTVNDWIGPGGQKVCEDTRTLTFSAGDDWWAIDYDITVAASEGKLEMGDTKEGSLGIRVAATMKVDAGKGGKIVNSEGQTDKGAWGKRAAWVDYHGPVGDKTVGVAMLNHPSSFRHPTYWHVRTYGLFAANPFGLRHFLSQKGTPGKVKLESGETLRLRHQFVFHLGDTEAGKVAEHYERYSKQK